MSLVFVLGRPCEPGWGYISQKSISRFVPIDVESDKVTPHPHVHRHTMENEKSVHLKDNLLPLSCLQYSSSEKYLDFFVNKGDEVQHQFNWLIITETKQCGRLPKDPRNCSHFVSTVEYGADLLVQLPELQYPGGLKEIEKSLNTMETSAFTPDLLEMQCRVLINYDEIRELTLEELINFAREIKLTKEYQVPVTAQVELIKNIPDVEIINEEKFQQFLSCLYFAFRKIELKLNIVNPKRTGFLDLETAKRNYFEMDEDNLTEIYPKLRELYFSYVEYLKNSINNELHIDEGSHISEELIKLQELLERIDDWNPVEENMSDENLSEDENEEDLDNQKDKINSLKTADEDSHKSSLKPSVVNPEDQITVLSSALRKVRFDPDIEKVDDSDICPSTLPAIEKIQLASDSEDELIPEHHREKKTDTETSSSGTSSGSDIEEEMQHNTPHPVRQLPTLAKKGLLVALTNERLGR